MLQYVGGKKRRSCVLVLIRQCLFVVLSVSHLSSSLISGAGKPKFFHVSDFKHWQFSRARSPGSPSLLPTSVVLALLLDRVLRMMGRRGPMASVISLSLRTALLQQKNTKLFFFLPRRLSPSRPQPHWDTLFPQNHEINDTVAKKENHSQKAFRISAVVFLPIISANNCTPPALSHGFVFSPICTHVMCFLQETETVPFYSGLLRYSCPNFNYVFQHSGSNVNILDSSKLFALLDVPFGTTALFFSADISRNFHYQEFISG